MSFNWKELQNGSDIRGIALEGIPGESVNLNWESVEILGRAFYTWLCEKGNSGIRIAVGMDSRISGPPLKEAFSHGITSMGGSVVDFGLASTPAMFMATKDQKLNVVAGVMLTASHLPFNRNGLKFFTAGGGLDKRDIEDVLNIAGSRNFADSVSPGTVEEMNFMAEYSGILTDRIRKGVNHPEHYNTPLEGMKIIVDAGNGAGGFFAYQVLEPLGADIEGSQFLEPDGMFPNHIPNPEDKEAMKSICEAVKTCHADLGVIFDTDVDRAAIVDHEGNPVNRNVLIALISAIVLEEHPGTTIVTDSVTSKGLTHFIEDHLKGKHHRFKRGYKNVINEAVRLNETGTETWIAIETSGHAALKENYFLDDGAYLVAKILIRAAKLKAEGKRLHELTEELQQPLESVEYRIRIMGKDYKKYGEDVIRTFSDMISSQTQWSVDKNNYEGIRVNCNADTEKGWFLLRLSLHDPLLPLNIESDVKGGTEAIRKKIFIMLSWFNDLDLSVS